MCLKRMESVHVRPPQLRASMLTYGVARLAFEATLATTVAQLALLENLHSTATYCRLQTTRKIIPAW